CDKIQALPNRNRMPGDQHIDAIQREIRLRLEEGIPNRAVVGDCNTVFRENWGEVIPIGYSVVAVSCTNETRVTWFAMRFSDPPTFFEFKYVIEGKISPSDRISQFEARA